MTEEIKKFLRKGISDRLSSKVRLDKGREKKRCDRCGRYEEDVQKYYSMNLCPSCYSLVCY